MFQDTGLRQRNVSGDPQLMSQPTSMPIYQSFSAIPPPQFQPAAQDFLSHAPAPAYQTQSVPYQQPQQQNTVHPAPYVQSNFAPPSTAPQNHMFQPIQQNPIYQTDYSNVPYQSVMQPVVQQYEPSQMYPIQQPPQQVTLLPPPMPAVTNGPYVLPPIVQHELVQPPPANTDPKKPPPPKFKVGDLVEAVWPVDSKWHAGKIVLSFGEEFYLIHWTDMQGHPDTMVSATQIRKPAAGGLPTNLLIAGGAGLVAYTLLIFLLGYWFGKRASNSTFRRAALSSIFTGLDHRIHEMRAAVGLEPEDYGASLRRAAYNNPWGALQPMGSPLMLGPSPAAAAAAEAASGFVPDPRDAPRPAAKAKGAGFRWWHALLGLLAVGGTGGAAAFLLKPGDKKKGELTALKALQDHEKKHKEIMQNLRGAGGPAGRFAYGLT